MRRPVVTPSSFSAQRPHLLRPMRIDPQGLRGPTRRAAQGASYRRTSHGYFLPAGLSNADPEQRIVEAAVVLPGFGAVTGWAALRWCGAAWVDHADRSGPFPVDLTTGYDDIRNQPGIRVSQERLGPSEITSCDGLRVTRLARSLFFAMRYAAGVRDAVRYADMTAHADLVSLGEIGEYAATHPGWTGVPQVRDALALADENAWSPREVDTRLCWQLDAGLPRPLTNRPLFDRRGRHLLTPDLLDPEAGVVVEYNGAVHLEPDRRRRDIAREELCRALGLELVVAVSGQSRAELVARMRAARSRARFAAESRREWTIVVPPWWSPTQWVDQRRALRAAGDTRALDGRGAAA
jgi:hypothetical protein